MNEVEITRLLTGIFATLLFVVACLFLGWKTKAIDENGADAKVNKTNDTAFEVQKNASLYSASEETKYISSEPVEAVNIKNKIGQVDKTKYNKVAKLSNTTSKFKKYEALNGKQGDCFTNKEVGGHSQPLVSLAFSANGLVCSLGKDRLLRCTPIADIGASSPHEFHCLIQNKDNVIPSCMTSTMNGRRILTGLGHFVDFYKLPGRGNSNMTEGASATGTIPKQLMFVKQLDCSIGPTSSVNPYNCSSVMNKNNTANTVTKMDIRSICTMDVEKWLVVLVSGVLDISSTVLTSSLPYTKDMAHANTYTTITVTLPFIRAYNHSGSVVFTLTPQHTAVMTTVGGGIGGVEGDDGVSKKVPKRVPVGVQEGCKFARVEELCMAVAKDSRVVAISGAGVHDTYSNNRDGRDACGLKSDEVGVFTVIRRDDGEASGLKLAYILSTQLPSGISDSSICLDISWCSDSKSLVSLHSNSSPKFSCGEAIKPTISNDKKNHKSSAMYFSSWNLSMLPRATKEEVLTSVAPMHAMQPDMLISFPQRGPGCGFSTGRIVLLKTRPDDSRSSIIAIGLGCSIYFYARETGQCIKTLQNALNFNIAKMHLCPDGILFATVVENAKRAPLWKYIE